MALIVITSKSEEIDTTLCDAIRNQLKEKKIVVITHTA